MKFQDGKVYTGEFSEGNITGAGVLTSKPSLDGKVKTWKGNFINGALEGVASYTGYDDQERKGQWSNGRKVKWLDDKVEE